jgi:DnaK suppressor protein
MTDEQRAQLRADLLALRDTLEAELTHTVEGARPVSLDEPIGRLSRMEAMQQQSMSTAQRTRMRGRLAQVMAALGRLDEGTYGECLRCEEPIAHDRLRIRPEATLCRDCQQQAG